MVAIDLKLNHILCFNDFHVNFSYPRKLGKTSIENENISNIPSFRYKKLNIFVGSNATGKTSLMKSICFLLDFLAKKDKSYLRNIVNDYYDESFIAIDFVNRFEKKDALHRVKIKTSNNGKEDFDVFISHASVELKQNDSYEKLSPLLDELPNEYKRYSEAFENNEKLSIGWNMVLPATEESFDTVSFEKPINDEQEKDYLAILNSVLKTLDPSIKEVTKSLDADDAIVIKQENEEKIIVQAGNKITEIRRLSSGTKYGINLANMIFAIKYHRNGIYLIDEQFSYVSSDIEVALLTTMVELLGEDEQIFFTTHNQNILSLGLPFHSFYFMKRREDNKVQISCASELENRNNVSPYNMYENDMFGSLPNVSKIYELAERPLGEKS